MKSWSKPVAVDYGSLPFAEQIAFFRSKLNLPTATWADIRKGMHARAFVVAGSRGQVLADFRTAIDKAIANGTTLAEFRKDFDAIVAQHGWSYNGGRGWRSRVIYDTNLRTSYAAGRYKQLQEVKDDRPFWRYRHSAAVLDPRELHVSWDGKVLAADDPWWGAHYPPNGWGCQCYVESLSERDLERLGKDGPDPAPNDGTYKVASGPFAGEVVPNGISPGWDYSVGESAWGKTLSAREWAVAEKGWDKLLTGQLTARDWRSYARSKLVPLDTPQAALSRPLDSREAVVAQLKQILGGDEKVFNLHGYRALINAEVLGQHIDPKRAEFLPLLTETMNDPYEIWLGFQRHRSTGKIALRSRVVKAFDLGKRGSVLLVLDAQNGMLTGHTFVPGSENRGLMYLQNQRWGYLLYGRED